MRYLSAIEVLSVVHHRSREHQEESDQLHEHPRTGPGEGEHTAGEGDEKAGDQQRARLHRTPYRITPASLIIERHPPPHEDTNGAAADDHIDRSESPRRQVKAAGDEPQRGADHDKGDQPDPTLGATHGDDHARESTPITGRPHTVV